MSSVLYSFISLLSLSSDALFLYPTQIQRGLDFVRVIGNNAVHPRETNLKDDFEIATILFSTINMIIDVLITKSKILDEYIRELPERERKRMEKRN